MVHVGSAKTKALRKEVDFRRAAQIKAKQISKAPAEPIATLGSAKFPTGLPGPPALPAKPGPPEPTTKSAALGISERANKISKKTKKKRAKQRRLSAGS